MDKSAYNIYFYSEDGVRSQPEGLTFLRSFAEVELAARKSYQIGQFLRRWAEWLGTDEPEYDDDKYVVVLMTKATGCNISVNPTAFEMATRAIGCNILVDPIAFEMARVALGFGIPTYVLVKAIDRISWEMLPVKRAARKEATSNRSDPPIFLLELDRPNSKHEIFNLVTSDKTAYTGEHINWGDAPEWMTSTVVPPGTLLPTLSAGVAYHYLNR